MRIVHIVGRRNHGKTTLLLELLDELRSRGLRAGTIKHTRHPHELDSPGKDSQRLREAGAAPSAIVSGDNAAIHFSIEPGEDFYETFEPLFAGCDIVLVEGHVDGPGPKLEVWRPEAGGGDRLALDPDVHIVAVVGDGPAPRGLPRLNRRDVSSICDFILDLDWEEAASGGSRGGLALRGAGRG